MFRLPSRSDWFGGTMAHVAVFGSARTDCNRFRSGTVYRGHSRIGEVRARIAEISQGLPCDPSMLALISCLVQNLALHLTFPYPASP